jgi:CubicO group peptidase (beta-lactamase class C family)
VNPLLPATEAALLRSLAEVQAESRQPSVVAGLVRDGSLVWTDYRGQSSGPDVQYRIGSITKSVTAIAVMQCRDDGLLSLDDSLGSHLGDDVPFASAPVRRLLSHSAGLPAEPEGPWWERHEGGDFAELSAAVAGQPHVHPVGERFHYTNLGYGLLGELVSRLRGQTWIDVVTERVLEPLGMSRTAYGPTAPHAQGYSVHPYAGTLDEEPHTDTGAMAPAGQLWSTVEDLARFAGFWIAGDAAVLGASSVTEMCTPAAGEPMGAHGSVYGLGVQLFGRSDRTLVGHGGSMPGFLAGFVVDPRRRTAGIALSNGTFGATPMLASTIVDTLEELEPPLATEWVPEPIVLGADELLGLWYWGNTPMTFAVRSGHLVIDHVIPGRRTRLVRETADAWRCLDHYYAGELLLVERSTDGTISHLDLITYRLTRAPYA